MLVLTRKVGQKIVIGDPKNPLGFISIERIACPKEGNNVRVGLSFPKDIPITRPDK